MIKNKKILMENAKDIKIRKIRKDMLNAVEYAVDKIGAKNSVEFNLNKLHSVMERKRPENVYLIAIGKASVPMAKTVLDEIDVKDGVVITNKKCPASKIPCFQSSHPIPSEKSQKAAELMVDIAKKASDKDLLVFLISGGGSALAEMPRLSLEDLKTTTDTLIKHNLTINEINCIRKHLSSIKGGQIIKYAKAHIVSFVISDVIGNDLSTIASGLTYYDDTTFKDAMEIIEKQNLKKKLPQSVIDFLSAGYNKFETLKKEDFPFERIDNFIISDNERACFYLREFLELSGYKVVLFSSKITQNVKDASEIIIKSLNSVKDLPAAIIFGGEPTVNVRGNGFGGRNQELALLLAKKIENMNAVFLSFATDGKDGNSPSAGAITDGYTIKRAKSMRLYIKKYIFNNDSYTFFNKLQDCIFTDDTQTNVADVQILIIYD